MQRVRLIGCSIVILSPGRARLAPRSPTMKTIFQSVLLLVLALPAVRAAVVIEYVAHACFVIESPSGFRVVIDPYNTNRWLGYHFPESIRADAVLITHPHYDHDASYYWDGDVPVFRAPGRYRLADIQITGLEGRHAEPYGEEFGRRNTIWLIEAGGVRIAHLGDNGPLKKENQRALKDLDALMLPVDDLDHILKRDEIRAIRTALQPRFTIPMHYRITSLSRLPETVGPISQWLGGQQGIRELPGNRFGLKRKTKAQEPQILTMSPSPEVKSWTPEFHQAWSFRNRAREQREQLGPPSPGPVIDGIVELLAKAHAQAPQVMVFSVELAEALAAAGRSGESLRLLETALAGAGSSDWEYTMRARAALAEFYEQSGQTALAARQYSIILKDSYRFEFRSKAEQFLRSAKSAGQ